MKLAEWVVHRAAKLVLRVGCPARSSSMMDIYFTDIKTQASIMWLEKKQNKNQPSGRCIVVWNWFHGFYMLHRVVFHNAYSLISC